MGSCAGKPKTVDGIKPEVVEHATDDAKAVVNSNNGETIVEDKTDVITTNKNGDNNDDKQESIKQEDEAIKEKIQGNNELKTEALAETKNVAEEEVEKNKVEVST